MTYLHCTTAGTEKNVLCIDRSEHENIISMPETEVLTIIDFTIHGKDYKSRKASCEQVAIDFSNDGDTTGLFYSDLWHISDWFYRNGKRYGLLKEFIENGLC